MFSRRTNWSLAPNRFSIALQKHRAAGRELLDLTASNPTTIGLRYDAGAILPSLSNPQALAYCPDAKGLRVARDAVAAYYRQRGASVDPERLVLTPSTSEAYSFVFRLLCDPGDEVLGPAPSYPLFEFLADIQDVRLRSYPLFYDHGWHVDLHALTTVIGEQTRAVMIVHPNNPTGSYAKPSDAAQLHVVCAERGLALVVDEVFLDFAHDGRARPSFVHPITRSPDHPIGHGELPRRALTFTLSGLSKIAGLPQMKFAWIAVGGPDEPVREALARLEVIADTYLSMNAPIQLAAPSLFAQRHEFQSQLMERIRANLAELDRQLAAQTLCQRLEIEGGWYVVLRVPVTRPDEDLAIALLEQKSVLVHPGHFYDFPADGYLVVSLIAPEREFKEGLKRLVEFVIGNL
ncbi:MAG: pyridoxal phosphate-dependent aminotransferase [Acidobacteriia bacterium]|nr:pyridoxal phosphate-dependent aminotransferase [Terriglobia bacterium]